MPKYFLTKKAVDDLSEIWEYTVEKWSENQADLYYTMLLDQCERIAKNPLLGKSYDGATPMLFGLMANRHVIFYRKIELGDVEIIRILHARMDLNNRILE